MAIRCSIIAPVLFLTFGCFYSTTEAALVFAINGQEGAVSGITLTQVTPTTNLNIQVRENVLSSGGDKLAHFGFTVRIGNPSVAKVTGVTINNSVNVVGGGTTTSPGNTGSAEGTYIVRPQVFAAGPGGSVTLATFTLTGVGPGTTSVFIDELTVDATSGGPIDFITSGSTNPVGTGQDRNGFSDPTGTTIGTASTFASITSTVVAVPEPASCVLVGGCLLGAYAARRRRSVPA